MDFTFGIITGGNTDENIRVMIESIINNNIPNYEIIIVGNTNIEENENIRVHWFNEDVKPLWITRKKNIIVENAKYENVVLLHDYVRLNDDWYNGFLKFGNDFDWCVTKIINGDGKRFRDYSLFPYRVERLGINYSPGEDIDEYFNETCLLPYNFVNTEKTNKYLYISGTYYIIKKTLALRFPLDEELCWDQGEDVEFSHRLHNNNIIIKCNPFSSVNFLKLKWSLPWEREICDEKLEKFIEYCNNS